MTIFDDIFWAIIFWLQCERFCRQKFILTEWKYILLNTNLFCLMKIYFDIMKRKGDIMKICFIKCKIILIEWKYLFISYEFLFLQHFSNHIQFNWRTFLRCVATRWSRGWAKRQVSTNQNSRNSCCQIV